MPKKKKTWKNSKTIWVNATFLALASLEANTGLLQPLLPINFYNLVAIALPIINTYLRVITTESIVNTDKIK